jgi:hypothetical protein
MQHWSLIREREEGGIRYTYKEDMFYSLYFFTSKLREYYWLLD